MCSAFGSKPGSQGLQIVRHAPDRPWIAMSSTAFAPSQSSHETPKAEYVRFTQDSQAECSSFGFSPGRHCKGFAVSLLKSAVERSRKKIFLRGDSRLISPERSWSALDWQRSRSSRHRSHTVFRRLLYRPGSARIAHPPCSARKDSAPRSAVATLAGSSRHPGRNWRLPQSWDRSERHYTGREFCNRRSGFHPGGAGRPNRVLRRSCWSACHKPRSSSRTWRICLRHTEHSLSGHCWGHIRPKRPATCYQSAINDIAMQLPHGESLYSALVATCFVRVDDVRRKAGDADPDGAVGRINAANSHLFVRHRNERRRKAPKGGAKEKSCLTKRCRRFYPARAPAPPHRAHTISGRCGRREGSSTPHRRHREANMSSPGTLDSVSGPVN